MTEHRFGRHVARLVLPLLAGLVALGLLSSAVAANVQVTAQSVETPDPMSVVFRLRATTPGGLQEAVVNYRVLNPDGNVGGSVRPTVTSGGTQDLSATLLTNNGERYIPVGSVFVYSWALTDADGVVHTTDEQQFVFLDGRFQWQSRSEGDVTVYWYGPTDAQAIQALQATADSIADNEALLRVQMPYAVRVVVYPNESAGELAQRPRGGSFDAQVVTGGARVASDLLHIYDSLGGFVDVTRHEAGHLVTKVAGDGPFTTIPSWLDEGVAVYSQTGPGGGYLSALAAGIASNSTIRLRSLAGPVNEASQVNLFYGQSWAVVAFMIDTYGEEAFAELFATVKGGEPIDAALRATYGVDQDGLYNDWRESVGLARIDFSLIPDATAVPRAEGTRAPLGIPTSVSGGTTPTETAASDGSAETGSEGGSNTMTAVIIVVVTLLVAGGLGGVGLRLMRKKA
ncbi:MAG: hypothetical protein CVU47_07655 [Chloroflexi bacterium HGW-Chloroflexi-9]|nr:MAG: hypothetical protein CVU47_07655 [Chloroflexi bacterium HGW-Chloroflexi-9]